MSYMYLDYYELQKEEKHSKEVEWKMITIKQWIFKRNYRLPILYSVFWMQLWGFSLQINIDFEILFNKSSTEKVLIFENKSKKVI